MDRLIREGNPPVGQLASPVPQYKRPGSTDYEAVEGQHGAPFATLKDASGNIVSPATEEKLEQARVLLNTISTKDFATQTTLAAILAKLEQLETEIQAVKANQVSGDQKVTLSGNIPEYLWLSTDTPPVLGATDRAFGVEMDTTTHEMTIYYWTGSAWQVKK